MSNDDVKAFGCCLFIALVLLIGWMFGANYLELNSKTSVKTLTCRVHELKGKRSVWYGRAHHWTVPILGKKLFEKTIEVQEGTKLKNLIVVENLLEQECTQKKQEFGSNSKFSASVVRDDTN